MTEKVYEFKKITDVLELTDDQFERFLNDFILWFKFQKEAREKITFLNRSGFCNVALGDSIR